MRVWVRGTAIIFLLAALSGCEIVPQPLGESAGAPPGSARAEPTAPPPGTTTPPATLPWPDLPPAPTATQPTGLPIVATTTLPALPQLPLDQRHALVTSRVASLQSWLVATGRRALLLEQPDNFAWATLGGDNQPVASAPAAALAVLPDRALLVGPSDTIDLVRQPLAGLGFRGLSYRWDLGRDPGAIVKALRGVAGSGVIAADLHRPGTEYVADALAGRRLNLLPIERQRVAWLAATTGETVAAELGEARPDQTQAALAAALRARLATAGVSVVELRVAALDQPGLAGLGQPTEAAIGAGVAVHLTVARWGLRAVVGRSVSPTAAPAAVEAMVTARQIYGALLGALRPGQTLRDVYRAGAATAAAAGGAEPFVVQPPGGLGVYGPPTRWFAPTAVEAVESTQAGLITVVLPGAYLADTVLPEANALRLPSLTAAWPAPALLVNGRPTPLPTLRGGELAVAAAEAGRRDREARAAGVNFLIDLVGGAARQALTIAAAPAPAVPAPAAEPAVSSEEDAPRPPAAGATVR